MCGIVGIIDFNRSTSEATLAKMTKSLAHRGPDDAGVWMAQLPQAQVGLGHRRLSILDLRPDAAQPMRHGSCIITYNGEIYNFAEIKENLSQKGHIFKTNSDTEVILHSYKEWGVQCCEKFIGMFAFVIIDEERGRAHLVRDRTGVKPLYIWREANFTAFASELKAFFEHPRFSPSLDGAGLSHYFDHGYVPSGDSIFQNVEKIRPGHYSTVDLVTGQLTSVAYWTIRDKLKAASKHLEYGECLDQFTNELFAACRYRTVSDVPIGVFLSGGYDSAAVMASLSMAQEEPVKAFTIGFDSGNNEVPQAKEIARHLGCDHHTYMCREMDAQAIIPQLPDIYDEPFADSSAIPTTLVSQLASEHVKVVISADGGDELFFGYRSYAQLGRRIARLSRIPRRSRRLAAELLFLAGERTPKRFVQKIHMLKGLSRAIQENDRQMALNLHHAAKELPDVYRAALFKGFRWGRTELSIFEGQDHSVAQAALWDYENYLVEDILVKVDRATMSASIEAREPLLDHKLAEFAAQLQPEYKMNRDTQKRILKDYVHKHIPKRIMEAPKRGFSVPVLEWLKGDLAYLIDDYINPHALKDSEVFHVNGVMRLVKDFKRGRLHYEPLIWKILMFQMWHRRWM